MSLQVVVTPGTTLADGTPLTYALLRQLARPTVTISGAVDASAIADGSIAGVKLKNADVDLDEKAVPGSLGTAVIADGAVTTAKVAPGAYFYADGVYAAGVYGVTVTPAPSAYAAGQIFRFKADTTNTGAVDVNINSLGAKNLYKNVDQELLAGDIQEDQVVEMLYDGTNFQLLGGSTPLLRESAEQAVATGVTTVAHGLGAVPRELRAVFVCKTADLGYSVGDEVDAQALTTSSALTNIAVGANATNLFANIRTTIQLPRYDNQNVAAITTGSWRLKFYYR